MTYVWVIILTSTFWIFGYMAVHTAKGITPKLFEYEVGEVVHVYDIQGFTATCTATVMERKNGLFGRPVYRVRMGNEQRWQSERGMFLINNTRHYHPTIYNGPHELEK